MSRTIASTLAALSISFFVPAAQAHGPTPQKIEETVTIDASPAVVWNVVKDFSAISTWHVGVAKSEGEGGNGNGANRTITLQQGGVLSDSLDDYNESEKSYAYRLAKENTEAFPVSFYSATLTVKSVGSRTEVEWIGRFYRGDTGNFPSENLSDEAAVTAMTKFFHDGLASLKTKIEGSR
jgi:mxaD protein